MSHLCENDLEELFDVSAPEIERKCWTEPTKNERSLLERHQKVRRKMRFALQHLEMGYTVDQILDIDAANVIEEFRGRPQTIAEAAVSMNRRMTLLAIQVVKPFATVPA